MRNFFLRGFFLTLVFISSASFLQAEDMIIRDATVPNGERFSITSEENGNQVILKMRIPVKWDKTNAMIAVSCMKGIAQGRKLTPTKKATFLDKGTKEFVLTCEKK